MGEEFCIEVNYGIIQNCVEEKIVEIFRSPKFGGKHEHFNSLKT